MKTIAYKALGMNVLIIPCKNIAHKEAGKIAIQNEMCLPTHRQALALIPSLAQHGVRRKSIKPEDTPVFWTENSEHRKTSIYMWISFNHVTDVVEMKSKEKANYVVCVFCNTNYNDYNIIKKSIKTSTFAAPMFVN